MIRSPQNTNLHLHYEGNYMGFPAQTIRAPLILEYLDILYWTIQRSLKDHPRVFAFRVDLRLPNSIGTALYLGSNILIERFIASFRAKIRHNRIQAKQKSGRAHDTGVRYAWARELGRCNRPHFHLVILLNNDAFYSLEKFEHGRENMFNRLQHAWASALDLPVDSVTGLVEIPRGSCYHLRREDGSTVAALCDRASAIYARL